MSKAAMTRAVFLVLVLVPCFALKIAPFQKQEELSFDLSEVPPSPPPPPPPPCKYNTSVECMTDECCNWCGLFFNATIGFCLPLIPVPIPALVCERVPSMCKTLLTPTTCAGSGDCKWVPMGPPGSLKGMCVYDWDKCKPPVPPAAAAIAATAHNTHSIKSLPMHRTRASSAASASALAVPPGPPKPKSVCNITVQATCDAHKCCQWCGTAFNLTAPGFCMPVLDFPMPTLTCSKGGAVCASAASEEDCDAKGVCSWHPFGPPGAKGPGICTFDMYKCA